MKQVRRNLVEVKVLGRRIADERTRFLTFTSNFERVIHFLHILFNIINQNGDEFTKFASYRALISTGWNLQLIEISSQFPGRTYAQFLIATSDSCIGVMSICFVIWN